MSDIIIHGASSFIGRHFSRLLSGSGHRLCILARQQSNISFLDNRNECRIIRYNKNLKEIDPHTVQLEKPIFYEFSWQGVFGSQRNATEQLTVNLPLMITSVSFAKHCNASHWIGIGSQAEYGNLNKKIKESDSCQPTTLYGKAKLMSSELTATLCKSFGMQHSWLRLFSVYGPDDNHEWLIQYLIVKMLASEKIEVTKGEQKWDYLYIDDICRLLLLLASGNGVGISNLGSGHSTSVRDIIENLRRITGTKSEIRYGAIPYRPDQVMLMEADISRLQSAIKWKPVISMEEGLAKTIAWFNKLKHQH